MSAFGKHKVSILFWVFLTISVPVTILLVAYAAGYRIEPRTGQIIELAGIAADSTPERATVLIDGQKQEDPTPLVKNVTPGVHTLELQLDGYYAWEKEVQLAAGKSVIFPDVLLFLETTPTTATTPLEATDDTIEPASQTVQDYYAENGWTGTEQMQTLLGPKRLLIDTAANQSFLLSRLTNFTDRLRIDSAITKAVWQDDVLLYTTATNEVWLYNDSTEDFSLLLRQTTPISGIAWHPDGGYIFYGDAAGLHALELDNRDRRQTWLLSTVADPTHIVVAKSGDLLQFTDTVGGVAELQLYKK